MRQPLLGSITTPNFMQIRSTVMEKWSRKCFTHICTCSGDVLYPLLSFRTHNSSLEGAIELKFVPFCSSLDALSDGNLVCRSQHFQILAKNHEPKTMHKAFLPISRSFFVVLLLHSGRCYEAEIYTILFLLRWPFIWYPFWPKSKFSDFGQKPWVLPKSR